MTRERQVKLILITPQDCTEENPNSKWKLRRPVWVIYDEIPVGKASYVRLTYPFPSMPAALPADWHPEAMDIMAGGGSIPN